MWGGPYCVVFQLSPFLELKESGIGSVFCNFTSRNCEKGIGFGGPTLSKSLLWLDGNLSTVSIGFGYFLQGDRGCVSNYSRVPEGGSR